MKKKLAVLLLTMLLVVGTMSPVFAASDKACEAADVLHELGLFNGTGTNADGTPNYDLDRVPTRHEAVTMLVRLLGKEEAMNGTWDIPFTDVADWAKPYVGYAYANGLTTGTSATTFGGNSSVTASQYLTFVLRALGYESGTDFRWDKAWELSDRIGLTSGQYKSDEISFLRGDVTIVSNNALATLRKGDEELLSSYLGLAVPAKLSTTTGELNLIRVDVLTSVRAASTLWVEGLKQTRDAIDVLEYGDYLSYHRGTDYAINAKSFYAAAEAKIRVAISQCGDYAENADMKKALQDYADSMIPITSFTIIDGDLDSLLVFIPLYSTVDFDPVEEMMNEWIRQIG